MRLNGVDLYLGRYGSPESKAEYDRVTSEWLARGRRPPMDVADGLLVKELILGYHSHPAATTPDIADKVKQALRAVRELYGNTEAAKFGPVAFTAIRLKMIEAGLAITTIRDRMGMIRRMVAWGVENEMLPADALERIIMMVWSSSFPMAPISPNPQSTLRSKNSHNPLEPTRAGC